MTPIPSFKSLCPYFMYGGGLHTTFVYVTMVIYAVFGLVPGALCWAWWKLGRPDWPPLLERWTAQLERKLQSPPQDRHDSGNRDDAEDTEKPLMPHHESV